MDYPSEYVELGVRECHEKLQFALGVSPYITAFTVVQLLQMDLLPKFVEWGKQGEVGCRKLNQATRYIALVLAFVQSVGITVGFNACLELNFTVPSHHVIL